MLNIDHIKTINDIYGHPTGNAVWARVAEHLQAVVRTTDTPAHFGGEEFVVTLPETGLQEAFALAELVRHTVAAKPYISAKSSEPALAPYRLRSARA
jgi:diguanylate cyclase (GGDEF)-like protein